MGATVDGFVADLNDYLGGEIGERLHKWAGGDRRSHELVARFEEEWDAAGAVVAGRRTAELMDYWGGSHKGAGAVGRTGMDALACAGVGEPCEI